MQKQIKTLLLYRLLRASQGPAIGLLRISQGRPNRIAQFLIHLYQIIFSPDKSIFFRYWLGGRVCRHHAHCSQYGYECFDHYSFFTACFRTMDRISRCTPSLTKSYDPVRYRVVFASGSPIGVPFLEALANDPRYEVVGVLTMPDMPVGRGMRVQENVIGVTGYGLGVMACDVKKPKSLRLDSKKYAQDATETYERLQSLDIDILYVVAYGYIIPQHILDLPKIAPINIHGSLLPAYRGASPLQTVFLDGLTETGITLMRMEAGLDSGPMIDKQIFKLSFTDTVSDLIQRVKEYTPKWSLDSIDRYVHGELVEEIQNESEVTFCGKINKEDGLVQCRMQNAEGIIEGDTLENIYRKYKAYYLWPKIFMKLKVKNGDIKVVTIDDLVIDEQLFETHKDSPLLDKNMKLNPAVITMTVKPEGSKSMDWDSFKNGYL